MRRWLSAALVSILLPACTSDDAPRHRGHIVVTTNILGDVVTEIVGDEADVTVLMPAGTDPHSFGLSARQADELQRAALVVSNGLGLEEGVADHVDAAMERGIPVLAVAPSVLDPAERDPHFWTDPAHIVVAIDVIADEVIDEVPGVDPQVVRRQTQRYARQAAALDVWIAEWVATVPAEDRELVTNHHVFGYFADAYGLEVVGAIIPSATTLASPSAADLADLVDTIRRFEVAALFVESSHPDALARVLADESGIEVQIRTLHSESLGPPGSEADTYLRMMRFNAEQIVAGLTGRTPERDERSPTSEELNTP